MRAPWLMWLAVVLLLATPAAGFPIRVNTATELTLNPTVSPDRRELRLAVLLRDDRRAAVDGRAIEVSIAVPGGPTLRREERTDANGGCVVTAHVAPEVGRVDVSVRFAGDEHFAPASKDAAVELDAPFVTVELSAPAGPLTLGEQPPPFSVAVNTGSAGWLAPGDLAVDLVAVEPAGPRVLAAAVSDAGGRAQLTVTPDAFPRAGIYQLRPRVDVRGRLVDGVGRTVLVRSETALTAALVSDPDDLRARLRGRLRTARDEPVGSAPVRLMRGDETVAAARTDAAGEFAFEVDLDRSPLAGATLRVRFDPADPWFVPSTSGGVRVGEAPSPPIHWGWMVAPWSVLALAVVAAALRRGGRPPAVEAPPVDVERDAVVRVGAVPDGAIEVCLEAFDRSTGAALPGARYLASDDPDAPERPASAALAVARGRALSLVVSADGYEPRRVVFGRLDPGRHRVRVGMLGWREVMFDRARPALVSAADGVVIPTPREAASAPRVVARGGAWVGLLERGAYGPDAPDAQTVRSLERALGGGEAAANDATDAVDAVN